MTEPATAKAGFAGMLVALPWPVVGNMPRVTYKIGFLPPERRLISDFALGCLVALHDRFWETLPRCLALIWCTAAISSPSHADVVDIAPNGALTIYIAPSIFTTEGVRPVIAPRVTQSRKIGAPLPVQAGVGALLVSAANHYAIREGLLQSVAWRESHFHNDAVSEKGAVGIMQLMAGTAHDLGVNRYDLSENIFGGAAYLKQMLDRYRGNEALALAAYNAGPGAVDRYGGVPRFRETQDYVAAIIRQVGPIQTGSTFVTIIGQ